MKHARIFLLLIVFIFPSIGFSKGDNVDALIVVDIDGTIGDQTPDKPKFKFDDVVRVPNDYNGDFYFYPGSFHFLETLFTWQAVSAVHDKKIEVALFTMGSGNRNELVRSFIEKKLKLKEKSLGLFDYSNAVFSEELVGRWRKKDPTLESHWRTYFDELTKPLFTQTLQDGAAYHKDLSRLLPFYMGLRLENIRIVDDNPDALPKYQRHQQFLFGPAVDYSPAIGFLKLFVSLDQ